MEALKRQTRFMIKDSKSSFIVFWIVVILVNIAAYILNAYASRNIIILGLRNGNGYDTLVNVAGSNIIAIGIYLIVSNMLMYYENFPTAIGFSSTRKDFYKALIIHNGLLCAAMTAIEAVLLKIDNIIIETIGKQPLEDFIYFNTKENNIFYVFIIVFLMFMAFCAVFNLLGALLYRYGYKLWIVLGVSVMIVGNIDNLSRIIRYILINAYSYNNFIMFFIKNIVIAALLYGLAWLSVRRLNVRTGK